MPINAQDVQRLRRESGAGVMDCKRALEDARGDFEKAKGLLRERGLEKAQQKADREAREGIVYAYVHPGGRIGALVELSSETDFVARHPDFRELAKEIAMQVAAMDPKDVDELLGQAYIREASRTIGELVAGLAASTGENVRVRRFTRFALGEERSELQQPQPTDDARDTGVGAR
ncbi:MAG: translation elongation factor Ts [Chloroflexi bacterium 13_1_40CM_3_70_6]|nr:MAG: translation elongation factor Ts [Chloroflexi bacterium 13_1_40CM_3_70_6]